MRFTRVRALSVVLIAFAGSAVVALQSPAQAAISTTHITSPANGAHYTVTQESPPHTGLTITGTSNGTTGDNVDIRCYFNQNRWNDGPTNVPVQADGSFTATWGTDIGYGRCRLRAVPSGLAAGSAVSTYTGPVVVSEYRYAEKIASGPNAGKTYDYYVAYDSKNAFNDYVSATDGGLWDSRLNYADGSSSNYLWYGDGALYYNENNAGLRSALQVDGKNAYGPSGARQVSPSGSGFPELTWSTSRNAAGDTTVREVDPIVFCSTATLPATPASCPTFLSAGVRLERTITTTAGGVRVLITDVWRSTNGKAHKIDAHYSQYVEGREYTSGSSTTTPVSFRTGWHGGYQTFSGAASYPGTSKVPNSLFVRDSNAAADGDKSLPRGSITFDFPVSSVARVGNEQANLLTAFTVPAHGTRIVKQAYAIGSSEAGVSALAKSDVVRLNARRADAVIRRKGGAWVGNDVYSSSAAGELLATKVKRGRTTTFLVTVQNDGTRSSGYRIRGAAGAVYLKGASGHTSITSKVVRGRYLTGILAPGQSRVFRIVVTVPRGVRVGALKTLLVRVVSTSDATSVDAVKARVKAVR